MIVEIDAVPTALPVEALEFQVQGSIPVFYAYAQVRPDPAAGAFRADQREIIKTGVNYPTGPRCWVWATTPTQVVTR